MQGSNQVNESAFASIVEATMRL